MKDYWVYAVMILVILITTVLSQDAVPLLRFDRELIAQGEWWRLWTASWVHLSPQHALGNGLGVLLLGYISGASLSNRLGLLVLFWTVMLVGIGLYWFAPDLQRYVGLSGALHGLLLLAPFVSPFYRLRVALIFAVVITVKVIWEQSGHYDDLFMSDWIQGRVEARSHLWGLIAGISALLVWLLRQHFLQQKQVNDTDGR